jgi:hypothetical protein
MITTTLGALSLTEPALARLAEVRLPVKTAYQVAKLLRVVKVEASHFEQQRQAYVRELGTERDPTPAERAQGFTDRVVVVGPADQPEFGRRMLELSNLVVELPAAPLALAALGAIDITAADLVALEPILEPDAGVVP